jgi:cyclopropane-fatty-acyl-phospholipid synthase
VVGVTVSEEQYRYATDLCRDLPVEIRLQDYRDIRETFDRVYSIGMFEHVGYRNYRRYMEIVRNLLNDGGLFLLHTIGGNRSVRTTDPWINRYIFPNGMLPSVRQIGAAIDGLFVMEDWHNFGSDYDTTLMHWFRNFDAAWPRLREGYDDRFYRMWKYYLLSCAASFRARKNQLWQVVLSVGGVPGGYEAPR